MTGSKPGWIIGGDEPELPFSEGDTSRAAAQAMAPIVRGLRQRVLLYIHARGLNGATDDEGFHWLHMRQVSYGARRNELTHGDEPLVVDTGLHRRATSNMDVKVWSCTSLGHATAEVLIAERG